LTITEAVQAAGEYDDEAAGAREEGKTWERGDELAQHVLRDSVRVVTALLYEDWPLHDEEWKDFGGRRGSMAMCYAWTSNASTRALDDGTQRILYV